MDQAEVSVAQANPDKETEGREVVKSHWHPKASLPEQVGGLACADAVAGVPSYFRLAEDKGISTWVACLGGIRSSLGKQCPRREDTPSIRYRGREDPGGWAGSAFFGQGPRPGGAREKRRPATGIRG